MNGDAERGLPAAVFGADPDVGRDLAQVDWAATRSARHRAGHRVYRPR